MIKRIWKVTMTHAGFEYLLYIECYEPEITKHIQAQTGLKMVKYSGASKEEVAGAVVAGVKIYNW